MVSGKQTHPFMTPDTKQTLLHKLNTHSATVAVIGLALRQAQDKATWACRWPWRSPKAASPSHSAALSAGVGIDVDPNKVDAINQGRSYISDIPSERLAPLTINHSPPSPLTATTDYSLLAHCDVAIICVPTPLNKTRDPDVRYHDPYVAQLAHNGHGLRSETDLEPALRSADCAPITAATTGLTSARWRRRWWRPATLLAEQPDPIAAPRKSQLA